MDKSTHLSVTSAIFDPASDACAVNSKLDADFDFGGSRTELHRWMDCARNSDGIDRVVISEAFDDEAGCGVMMMKFGAIYRSCHFLHRGLAHRVFWHRDCCSNGGRGFLLPLVAQLAPHQCHKGNLDEQRLF